MEAIPEDGLPSEAAAASPKLGAGPQQPRRDGSPFSRQEATGSASASAAFDDVSIAADEYEHSMAGSPTRARRILLKGVKGVAVKGLAAEGDVLIRHEVGNMCCVLHDPLCMHAWGRPGAQDRHGNDLHACMQRWPT